jgi:hypothetical protein
MMTDSSVITRETGPLTAPVNDEIVMLVPDQGAFFGLNPVAARIWEIIATPTTIEAICATLIDEFDVDEPVCRGGVSDFVHQLAEARLVEIR